MTRRRINKHAVLTKAEKAQRYRTGQNKERANIYAAKYRERNREMLRSKALGFHEKNREKKHQSKAATTFAVYLKGPRGKAVPPLDATALQAALDAYQDKGGTITHLPDEVAPPSTKVRIKGYE